jgi:hypothetical protein
MKTADPFTTSQTTPVACLYMPHFAAWAVGETQEGREAVIVHARKRVYSACPAYLRQGLRLGTSLHRARLMFPHARFLLRDIAAEQIYADTLRNRLYQLTPWIAPIDDRTLAGCWIALQGFSPDELSAALNELLAQGGCAPLLSCAMLAAAYAPAGQLHTPPTRKEFFHVAPIQPLAELGVSPRTLEFLQWVGMKTLADLYRLTRRHLQARFGQEGGRLFALLHPPIQPTPVSYYTPRSVTVSRTIPWPLVQIQDFHPHLEALIRSARGRISAHTPTWIRLTLTQEGGAAVEQFRSLKAPFHGTESLDNLALYLLTNGLEKLSAKRPVERLALTLGGLIRAEPIQESLFRSPPKWDVELQNLSRRFPHQLLRPVHNTHTPFLPEEEFSLGPLAG